MEAAKKPPVLPKRFTTPTQPGWGVLHPTKICHNIEYKVETLEKF